MTSTDTDVKLSQDQWTPSFSAQTYIEHPTERLYPLLGLENVYNMNHGNSSMESEYHPDTEDTPLLDNNEI